MPIPTPFHARTAPLVESYDWRDWSGFLAASLYEPSHEREYYAIRNAAGLIDVSPLFKYEVTGPDALRLVDRVMTRNIAKCAVGQVMYSPWCDEDGQVIDDGTVARLDDNHFRITAADPSLRWFQDVGYGLNAQVVNASDDLAALALQGPLSRAILQNVVTGLDMGRLRYFRLGQGQIDGRALTITRTGYTGDLGYELWLNPRDATAVWDMLMEVGQRYGLLPAGMLALDVARIEAGLLLADVDYKSALKAVIPDQLSSPYELGLGWAVALDGADFIGKRALLREKAAGSEWAFVGVKADWQDLERLFGAKDLPPKVAGRASRTAVPLYKSGKQVGQITSHTFSPILKEYIGIGTVYAAYGHIGNTLEMEFTIEYQRQRAKATVVKTPFFEPERKRK
ncbi:MAG: aminomethyl transferase family protein [Chloroflexi bacterium]|nr:aminomethyl transferase family protein [Ardenticatenaceae bacterium]MBL1128296.1 aminomethyl transferase family protein [Chloroflexota bacterium]NOG34369.1 aminomethyl transferase family protein [Chloroflexota bacterium]GIK57370.1 MAG: glycine cleavage system protein T [Chloroflexota bacterium]